LPQAEHKEITNASHIMHEDNPDDYNAVVISFLEKYSPSAKL
jgi:pimeloyl-ACP methyl ester carboxylesterase